MIDHGRTPADRRRRVVTRRRRVALALTSALLALTVPASAKVQVTNKAKSQVKVSDAAPLYSYASGTLAQWITNAGFNSGASSSLNASHGQNYASVQVASGVVSTRTHGEGLSATTATEWTPTWTLSGVSNAVAASVATRSDGLVAVAVTTSANEIKVARQVAPGVWPTTISWVTALTGVAAKDLEIAFNPLTGYLTAVYIDGGVSSWTMSETAPGTWTAATSLAGGAIKASLVALPNGDMVYVATSNDGKTLWSRTRVSGTWNAWVNNGCVPSSNVADLSAVYVGGKVVVYEAAGTTLVTCVQPAAGTAYTLTTVYSGSSTSITAVGAAARFDGSVLVMSNANNAQQATVQTTPTATITWTSVGGVYSDMEADGFGIATGMELAQTGTSYATSGTWTSPVVDTGTGGSGVYGMLRAAVTTPAGTGVTFQVAASASPTPSSFVGPDGTSSTSYPATGGALPFAIDGLRYVQVRATLTGSGTATPRLMGLSVRYNLARVSRTAGGTYAVTAPADLESWVVRLSTTDTTLSLASTKLVDTGSTWGASNSFTGAVSLGAPKCCGPTQFTVTSGSSSASGGAGTAVVTSGGRVGQSVVLKRTTLFSGSGNVDVNAWLSTSLGVVWPLRITLAADIAISKTATQSSDFSAPTATAAVAVDGNTNGMYGSGTVSATTATGQTWWQVDLGSSQAFSEIRLWNRTDCCNDRLRDYAILTSNSPITLTSFNDAVNSTYNAGGNVQFLVGTSPQTTAWLMPVGATARYIAIIHRAPSLILSLAEVEVLPTYP